MEDRVGRHRDGRSLRLEHRRGQVLATPAPVTTSTPSWPLAGRSEVRRVVHGPVVIGSGVKAP